MPDRFGDYVSDLVSGAFWPEQLDIVEIDDNVDVDVDDSAVDLLSNPASDDIEILSCRPIPVSKPSNSPAVQFIPIMPLEEKRGIQVVVQQETTPVTRGGKRKKHGEDEEGDGEGVKVKSAGKQRDGGLNPFREESVRWITKSGPDDYFRSGNESYAVPRSYVIASALPREFHLLNSTSNLPHRTFWCDHRDTARLLARYLRGLWTDLAHLDWNVVFELLSQAFEGPYLGLQIPMVRIVLQRLTMYENETPSYRNLTYLWTLARDDESKILRALTLNVMHHIFVDKPVNVRAWLGGPYPLDDDDTYLWRSFESFLERPLKWGLVPISGWTRIGTWRGENLDTAAALYISRTRRFTTRRVEADLDVEQSETVETQIIEDDETEIMQANDVSRKRKRGKDLLATSVVNRMTEALNTKGLGKGKCVVDLT